MKVNSLVIFMILVVVSACLAQDSEFVDITTYYPSPNLVAQDLTVNNTITIHDKMVIKQDTDDTNNNYLSVEDTSGSRVLYIGEDAADFQTNFIGNIFVEDTLAYGNCWVNASGNPECGGGFEGRVDKKQYAGKPSSYELSGIVLSDMPVLSNVYSRNGVMGAQTLPANNVPGYVILQDQCYYDYEQERLSNPALARQNFDSCIHDIRNNVAYPAFISNTDSTATPYIRTGKMPYMVSMKRHGGFFIAIGFGVQEWGALAFGWEFAPVTYDFTYRKWRYELNPCYYDALSAHCS